MLRQAMVRFYMFFTICKYIHKNKYIYICINQLVAWPWVVKGWWLSLSENSDNSFFKEEFSHSMLPYS